ncbi:MAG: HD domain-containing protein [Thermoproteota archaeon]|nr:HD domain-containing protein [Thermoproteota archaeon]
MKLDDYLTGFNRLRALYNTVNQEFSSKRLVQHDWNHVLRDVARAITIGEAEKADVETVLAATLLHDIGRLHPEMGEDHVKVGARLASKLLENADFTDKQVKEIVHCIETHETYSLKEPKSIEAKVVHDADALEKCGEIGVARVFNYFIGEKGLTIKQMMETNDEENELHPPIFYTQTGNRLGEKRFLRAHEFWKQLRNELAQEERETKSIIPSYEEK